MLASTVQFSNNNQPPATPTPNGMKYTGTGNRDNNRTRPLPQTPNSVPSTTSHPTAFHTPLKKGGSTHSRETGTTE